MTRRGLALSAAATALALVFTQQIGTASARPPTPRELAALDISNLGVATFDVETQAMSVGALRHPPRTNSTAKILLASLGALTAMAIRNHPSLTPTDTTAVMGPVPPAISHHLRTQPRHARIRVTHTLRPFSLALADAGSRGLGHRHRHDGAKPAPFQLADGRYVRPMLPGARPRTIGMVALRAALAQLGQPYVWAAAGPDTFDCSGLVQWAYAHAGLRLVHHAASQWNQGRLIPGRDILPGDLVLFGRPIFHVGIYLDQGWMLNAPYTGQYVDVVPVPSRVAGVIRP
jgi:cell wall-associated NlpC family hydrolase